MKKIMALLLVAVMCLCLVACGSSKENAIVGTWMREDGGTIVFDADGTAHMDEVTCTWEYDEDLDSYTVFLEIPITFKIETENNVRFFDAWGIVKYYHADDYEKTVEASK